MLLTESLSQSGWDGFREEPESQLKITANDALEKLVRDFQFQTILDIGCGAGEHSKFLRNNGKRVTALDLGQYHAFEPDIKGDYLATKFPQQFDAIWCAHTLEHIRNFGVFLDKIFDDTKEGGVIALTVPPAKHNIVGGHVTIWNPGLLLYNMIISGFDCRQASVKTYGYNISVIVTKIPTGLPRNSWSMNDLAKFFPLEAKQGFDGRIKSINW